MPIFIFFKIWTFTLCALGSYEFWNWLLGSDNKYCTVQRIQLLFVRWCVIAKFTVWTSQPPYTRVLCSKEKYFLSLILYLVVLINVWLFIEVWNTWGVLEIYSILLLLGKFSKWIVFLKLFFPIFQFEQWLPSTRL